MRLIPLAVALFLLWSLSGCSIPNSYVSAQVGTPAAWSRPLSDEPLEQTLVLPPGGADELEIVAALPVTGTVPTEVQWLLSDSATRQSLGSGTVAGSTLRNNSPLRIPLDSAPHPHGLTLALTADGGTLSLWTTDRDSYAEGVLSNNALAQDRDLLMIFRRHERPEQLPALLSEATERWPRVPPWLLLLAVMPGWMLLSWIGDRRARPLTPAVTAVSVALVPIVHALLSLLGQRVYDPLSRSLLMGATLTTLLLLLRRPQRLRTLWSSRWAEALGALLLALLLAIGTWLLATRGLLALPGTAALPSAVAARQMMAGGAVVASSGALPLASMTSVLGLLTLSEPVDMMLLLALMLGVSLVSALFLLGSEITRRPWGGLVLLPLAWLWPAPWQALAQGDLPALYSMALLPAAVGLAIRALTTAERGGGILVAAALPLAGLALVQGSAAPLALGIALALALWLRRFPTADDPLLPARRVLQRAALLLVATLVVLLPALWYSYSLAPLSTVGYPLLLIAIAAALLLRRLRWGGPLLAVLAVLALLPLAWQRSVPVAPQGVTLTADAHRAMTQEHAADGAGITEADGTFLIAMARAGEQWIAEEGTAWLPVMVPRRTTLQLQREIEIAAPGLLDRALAPGALDDATLRAELRQIGVRYLMLDSQSPTLDPLDILGKAWAQLLYHMGTTYIFEILP